MAATALFAAHLASALRVALPGYRWLDDLDHIPTTLRGVHPANPVNRPREQGVQIELPPRVRRDVDADVLVSCLASAVEQWQEV